jgi:hypothetical protein
MCTFHHWAINAPRSAPGKQQPDSDVSRLAEPDDPLSAAPNPRLTFVRFNISPGHGRAEPVSDRASMVDAVSIGLQLDWGQSDRR